MTKKDLEKWHIKHKTIKQTEIQKIVDGIPCGIIKNYGGVIDPELWEVFEKMFDSGYTKASIDYQELLIKTFPEITTK